MSEIWWVSVGGEACEPARVVRTEVEGVQEIEVFTIGCEDGTKITPDCGMELVKRVSEGDIPPKPLTAEEKAKQDHLWEAARARDRSHGIRHGYRRFT